ncbi:hypothetical protein JC2156_05610 [Weissella koreensis KCTC 3621]|uniref:hypothetical protein n=1 Tax=Weissella koreensis TaxID=165096 RepID=UPI00026F3EEB|nr:hypothetical protein [Weissella koreensis]EJF33747.1 hypothetical protein JC2156_05610 [Weissella koreensis KCTC 3621]
MPTLKNVVIPDDAVILNAGQTAKLLGLKTYYSFDLIRYSPQFKRAVHEVAPNKFLRSEVIKFKDGIL